MSALKTAQSDRAQHHLCSRDKRAEVVAGVERPKKPLSSIQSLCEQLVCQHHYEALIPWSAPVFGSPGVWWPPPLLDPSLFFRLPSTLHPQKLRKHSGIPIHPRMIEWAWTRRKGSCDEREKEKRVCTHVPFCAFSYHPSCLPRPCPHNRVLTGAVSRQH